MDSERLANAGLGRAWWLDVFAALHVPATVLLLIIGFDEPDQLLWSLPLSLCLLAVGHALWRRRPWSRKCWLILACGLLVSPVFLIAGGLVDATLDALLPKVWRGIGPNLGGLGGALLAALLVTIYVIAAPFCLLLVRKLTRPHIQAQFVPRQTPLRVGWKHAVVSVAVLALLISGALAGLLELWQADVSDLFALGWHVTSRDKVRARHAAKEKARNEQQVASFIQAIESGADNLEGRRVALQTRQSKLLDGLIIGQLQHPNAQVRAELVGLLWPRSQTPEDPATVALQQSLRDQDKQVRLTALEQLLDLGYAEDEVRAEAIALGLRDPATEVRRRAAQGAAGLAKNVEPLEPRLLAVKNDADPQTRSYVAVALHNAGETTPSLIPDLIEAIQQGDAKIRMAAVNALAGFGSQAAASAPQLVQLVRDPSEHDGRLRQAALATLAVVAEPEDLTSLLVDLLRGDRDNWMRSKAAELLGGIGPAAAEVATRPLLATFQNDGFVYARANAASALGQVAPESAQVAETLARALPAAEIYVQRGIVESLATMAPHSGPTAPQLRRALGYKDLWVRMYAALALLGINSNDQQAAEVFHRSLEETLDYLLHPKGHNNAGVARYTFGKLGARAKPIVPKLIELLSHERPMLRMQAAYCLGAIGPAAIDSLQALIRLRDDEDEHVRLAAEKAIQQIEAAEPPTP